MNAGKRHAVRRLYKFGAFRLDPSERIFARQGVRTSVCPEGL